MTCFLVGEIKRGWNFHLGGPQRLGRKWVATEVHCDGAEVLGAAGRQDEGAMRDDNA